MFPSIHKSPQREFMKIVHIDTYDTTGGAALATYRLHDGLRRLGHESLLVVATKSSDDPTVLKVVPKMAPSNHLRRRLRQAQIDASLRRYTRTRPIGYGAFSDDRTAYAADLARELPPSDVINLHWIANFVDYQSFFSTVPKDVPIFWRLSDMNAMTGGCHFDHDCGRHSSGCGACPQLGSSNSNDLSRQIWRRKEAVFGALGPERLHFVALNEWMADLVRRNPMLGKFQVTVVPNGVDTEVFAPRDGRAARNVLGIPQDALVVLFVAESITDRRKGFAVLVDALNGLKSCRNAFLLSVGRGSFQTDSGIPRCHVGHLKDRRLLSLVYSAADIFVVPSLQDNQPNTVLEAMACGVPVVASRAGGIADMVRPGITGQLSEAGDVKGLRDAMLNLLLDREKRAAMATACRSIVMNEYPLERQVRRYVELYERGLADRSRSVGVGTRAALAR
jgi:glycosyltransferase involved in cell wall biosynthesis